MGSGSSTLTSKQSVNVAKALLLECEGLKGSEDYKAKILVRKCNEILLQKGNRSRIGSSVDRPSTNHRAERSTNPLPVLKGSKSSDVFIPVVKDVSVPFKSLGSYSTDTVLEIPLASYSQTRTLDNDDHALFYANIEVKVSKIVDEVAEDEVKVSTSFTV